jgi:hypothetical protein
VLLGRGLCDGLITRPEDRTECGASECDREASIMRRPTGRLGAIAPRGGDGGRKSNVHYRYSAYSTCNITIPV